MKIVIEVPDALVAKWEQKYGDVTFEGVRFKDWLHKMVRRELYNLCREEAVRNLRVDTTELDRLEVN